MTIGELLDAAIASIDEIGYARTSASVIAARGGMSYGALFRPFDSMAEFMAATAHEAVSRHAATSARVRQLVGQEEQSTLAATLQRPELLGVVPGRRPYP